MYAGISSYVFGCVCVCAHTLAHTHTHTHTHMHTHTHEYDADAGTQGLMRVVARRTYAPGEQVFVAYGDKSNDSLLQNYGFSEEGNPFDNFRLSSLLPWLEEHQVFFNLGLLQPFFSSLSSLGLTNMRYSFNTNMRYSFNTFCLFSTSPLICSCTALRIMRRSCNFFTASTSAPCRALVDTLGFGLERRA